MSAVPGIVGVVVGVRHRQIVAFGELLLKNECIDVNHTLAAEKINQLITENNIQLFPLNGWKKFPFVKGDESSGYWVNRVEFNQFKKTSSRLLTFILIAALAFIIASIILMFLNK